MSELTAHWLLILRDKPLLHVEVIARKMPIDSNINVQRLQILEKVNIVDSNLILKKIFFIRYYHMGLYVIKCIKSNQRH